MCVLLRGFNDDQIEGFARFAREEGVAVRFIEFMPLEEGRLWTPGDRGNAQGDCGADRSGASAGGAAAPGGKRDGAALYVCRWGGRDRHYRAGEQAFCGACSRVRLTSDGKIRTCLFSQVEHDLYGRLRGGATDEELRGYILRTIQEKEARHHIGEPGFMKPSRSMVHIGG